MPDGSDDLHDKDNLKTSLAKHKSPVYYIKWRT
jgi:hypothetical protein